MREVRVVIFLRGNLCGVQMSSTLVFSDDLSHSSAFPECGLLKGEKTRRHGGGSGGVSIIKLLRASVAADHPIDRFLSPQRKSLISTHGPSMGIPFLNYNLPESHIRISCRLPLGRSLLASRTEITDPCPVIS